MTAAMLPASKMGITKNGIFFSLLRKLLAKLSCKHPPTMASADYHSGTPLLPTMPFPGRNDSKWSWLIDVCLGTRWGAPRRPWDDGGRHGWKVCLALILLVFCVLFYVDMIAAIAENRLRSIIMIIISSFNYVALLHSMLANVSTPRSWGWALWRPWYNGGHHGLLCFRNLQAWLLSFVLQMHWFLHWEGVWILGEFCWWKSEIKVIILY